MGINLDKDIHMNHAGKREKHTDKNMLTNNRTTETVKDETTSISTKTKTYRKQRHDKHTEIDHTSNHS